MSCDKLFPAQLNSEGETFYDTALKMQSGGISLNILCENIHRLMDVLLPAEPITFLNRFIWVDMVYLRLQNFMHLNQSRAIRALMIHKSV